MCFHAKGILKMINSIDRPANNVKTSIFYINDFHGKSINMERTITASNAFDAFIPSVPTDKLKLSFEELILQYV